MSSEWQPTPAAARKPVGCLHIHSPPGQKSPYPEYGGRPFDSPDLTSSRRDGQSFSTPEMPSWDPWLPSTPTQSLPAYGDPSRHSSRTALLTPELPAANSSAQAAPDQGLLWPGRPPQDQRAWTAVWYDRYWDQAWNMYVFLLLGILFACGHHLFYKSLHGQEADNQLGMLRYGTALAFLAKANLVGAVLFAYRQRAWKTVREKMLTFEAVDSLFATTEDLTAFFNWEVFRSAKVAMCLAIYIWATPLVVILSSETLSVTPLTKTEDTTCPEIRTLNFTHEETKDWRDAIKIKGLFALSLSLWNTTSEVIDPNDPDSFDYWTDTSQQYREVAWMSAYLQETLARKNAAEEICGVGWNCSFTVDFVGPGYQCKELGSGRNATVKNLGGSKSPLRTEMILPDGNYSYIGVTDIGDYAAEQIDCNKGGYPKQSRPYPAKLGAFRTEPILWIGYAAVDDTTKLQPENNTADGWYDAYTPTIFGCEHYETKYTVRFNYTGSVQSHEVTQRQFMEKVIDTIYAGDFDHDDTVWDNTTAEPEANYVYPRDVERYRKIGAYHSLGKQLRYFLNGTIRMPHYISETKIVETRLIDNHNYLAVLNLQDEVQKLYEEMILSMLSNPQFIAVSWARDPSLFTGVARGGSKSKYPCTRERTTNCYVYHTGELWAVYVVAIAIALVAVAIGFLALREEGVPRDNRFSSIVAATRGQSLNKIHWDQDPDAKKFKVGFGTMSGPTGERVYGFGLPNDITQAGQEQVQRGNIRRGTLANMRDKAGIMMNVIRR